MNPTLWTPSPERIEAANMTRFRRHVAEAEGVDLPDYNALYDWSIAQTERFWLHCWDFLGIRAETRGDRVLIDADKMPGAKFFPDAKLNFAENLMRVTDDRRVLTFWGEDKVKTAMTGAELSALVSRLQQFLKAQGVSEGVRSYNRVVLLVKAWRDQL